MQARRIQLIALALAGMLIAPSALAQRSYHDPSRVGVVIHLGSSLGSIIQTAKPWRPHQQPNKSYHQGYKDGYKAGVRRHNKQSRYRRTIKRHHPQHLNMRPPGHYRLAPGHKVHHYR